MKIIYQSILGGNFDTAALAMADEDRLPRIIEKYEADLERFVEGKPFASSKAQTKEEAVENRRLWQQSIDNYKEKWTEVQKQRGITA